MGRDSLAFGSVADYLRVPAGFVHTSIAKDLSAASPDPRDRGQWDSWFADSRDNPGEPSNYEQVRYGNPRSFAAELARVRASPARGK
jgi:hypothetical protein